MNEFAGRNENKFGERSPVGPPAIYFRVYRRLFASSNLEIFMPTSSVRHDLYTTRN